MVGLLKTTQFLGTMFLILFVLIGCTNNKDDEVITIGITQIVEHPALDKNREGFIAGLASRGYVEGENVEFDYQNAQGEVATAHVIATGFVNKKVDMIMAIATPTAQAAKNATTEIPVIFSSVTDPVDAGLVDSMESPGGNVTGTSDMSPISKQFDLMEQLFPNKKRVGMIYNTSESNSLVQVQIAQEIALERNYTLTLKGVTSTNDLQAALDILLDDVDLLFVPTDNLIASSMPILVSKSLEKQVPIIGTEQAHVEAGALITEGIDYYNLGFQTGLMAADVLDGIKEPSDLPVETLSEAQLVINTKVASELGITIPDELKNRATLIDQIGSEE